jgi:hypothetical protein
MKKQFVNIMSKCGTFNGQWCPLKNKLPPSVKNNTADNLLLN